jgi:tryptophan synthase beta chain
MMAGGAGKDKAAADPEAETRLLQALQENPDDRASRVHLLELYFEAHREEDFLREAKVYRNSLQGNLDTTDWQQIRSIGLTLFPGSPVFGELPARAEPKRRLGEDSRAKPHFEALAEAYALLREDPRFLNELDHELLFVADRPTPLLHARRLSAHLGGAQIYIKREDLAPPGSHLQISVVGQALLAHRLKKKTLVTGTVYGQRGVVMAQEAARLGMKAIIYMDPQIMAREPANVFRMWLCGAEVQGVDPSRLRGGDVREAALHEWLRDPAQTMLVMGLDWGPAPYPMMAREFSAVIGRECRRQALGQVRRSPDLLVARGGNNPDAIGFFQPFLADDKVRLACVTGGKDLPGPQATADEMAADEAGMSEQQRRLSDAILEGTEYLSVTREHAWLRAGGRVEYHNMGAEAAKSAIGLMSRLEGMIPPIDTAHMLAWAFDAARGLQPQETVVVALCERADKDILKIGRSMGVPL